jgi:drug/metabolite transporter (DMT)-like permease
MPNALQTVVRALHGMSTVTHAIALMALAAILSAILHVGVRLVSKSGLPVVEIVFLRTLLSLLVTAPFVFRPGQMSWRSNAPSMHGLRGVIGTTSMWAWYFALANMPLGLAATLGQTTSLFLVVGAALWFREHVGGVRWLALLGGMLGAVIALQPGTGQLGWTAMIAILSSVLWAISLLMAKDMTRYDSPLTISFYQPLTIAPLALLATLPVWVTPTLTDLGVLTGMGIAASLASYCAIKALGMADASVTAPIEYTKILWSTAAAYVMFSEVPGLTTWIGGALIVAATLGLTIYERRKPMH